MARLIICLVALLLASQSWAKTVTDIFGRTVTVPDNVERIIALGSSMSFVTYLHAQKLAVGVEDVEKTADSTKPYVQANFEMVKDLPVIGKAGAVRIPNYERIISLKPDVVFIVSTDRGEPDLIQRKLSIPVVAVSYGMPNFDQDVFFRSIGLTAEVLGRQERAEELISYIKSLPAKLSYAPGKDAEAYLGGISFKGNQGLNSTAADFLPMKLARIKNITDAEKKRGQFFVNREYVLAKNPEIIFIDGNGLSLIADDVRKNPEFYARLRAFRNGQVFLLLPHTSYFSNPEMLYVNAFLMAKSAYPEKYGNIDPEEITDEILTAFNGKGMYGFLRKTTGGYGVLELTPDGIKIK
ncbi:ABC transporter substrate-binding protein [Geovibrio thiophilus]|uniref:ABC transporter substrate-binding protein n=1 Tax=Geovibrio thiophilus TaxID=139438 RepID=A0A3R5YXX1_9BACT|nr:ABC transporter substrate-binding protein [Geovibrio thiophilus]QAR32162.1 ABC transporter substrate-binding protein [Geovibrio thiophilus]